MAFVLVCLRVLDREVYVFYGPLIAQEREGSRFGASSPNTKKSPNPGRLSYLMDPVRRNLTQPLPSS